MFGIHGKLDAEDNGKTTKNAKTFHGKWECPVFLGRMKNGSEAQELIRHPEIKRVSALI